MAFGVWLSLAENWLVFRIDFEDFRKNGTIHTATDAILFPQSAAAASNVKIFRFTSSNPLPRTINQTTSVATLFPTGVPSPVTATLTAFTPARVWIFGGAASTAEPSVTAYNYATSTGTFTYYGLVSKQWTNTLVTAASHWYNATSGVMRYHLFDSSSPSPNVVEVDTALQVRTKAVHIRWSEPYTLDWNMSKLLTFLMHLWCNLVHTDRFSMLLHPHQHQ